MKKTICIILTIVVTTIMLTSATFAAQQYSEGFLHYQVDNNSVTITGYFGSEKSVHVPSAIAGYPVNSIGKGAFSEKSGVKTLYLPTTIMEIKEGAVDKNITVKYVDSTGNVEAVVNPEGKKDKILTTENEVDVQNKKADKNSDVNENREIKDNDDKTIKDDDSEKIKIDVDEEDTDIELLNLSPNEVYKSKHYTVVKYVILGIIIAITTGAIYFVRRKMRKSVINDDIETRG